MEGCKMKIKKIIATVVTLLIIIGAIIAYKYFSKIYVANVIEDSAVYIPSNATFDDVSLILHPYLNNSKSFNWKSFSSMYLVAFLR